ncbi:MAG: hypothetical protein ACFB10_11105 [Salibacteraceae bacterium]
MSLHFCQGRPLGVFGLLLWLLSYPAFSQDTLSQNQIDEYGSAVLKFLSHHYVPTPKLRRQCGAKIERWMSAFSDSLQLPTDLSFPMVQLNWYEGQAEFIGKRILEDGQPPPNSRKDRKWMAPFLATESLLTTYTRFHHAVLDLEMRIKFEFNVEGKLLHVNLREMPGKDKWNVPLS